MSRAKKTRGLRSKLEVKVEDQLIKYGVTYEYEPADKKISYVVPAMEHRYTADFVIPRADGSFIYVEAKGIWDYADRYKHLLIRQQHPELDIRFVFQRAGQRIRKCSKTTYRDICEGRGRAVFKDVVWQYSDNGIIPREWFN